MRPSPKGKVRTNAETIINDYEKALGSMVGYLSRFIVRKQYGKLVDRQQVLDIIGASMLSDLVVDEAAVLVGRSKADELKMELARINDSYFKKEA